MRRFAYCKVVLATSLVWVMLDMFILLYFSECNKCDNIKERGLPGRDGEFTMHTFTYVHLNILSRPPAPSDYVVFACIYDRCLDKAEGWARGRGEACCDP